MGAFVLQVLYKKGSTKVKGEKYRNRKKPGNVMYLFKFKNYFPYILIVFGISIVISNIIGFFYYTTIDNQNPYVYDDKLITISEKEFWDSAYRENDEELKIYVQRLSKLISDRMLQIDPKYNKPTFFENYILWFFSKYLGYYEWRSTEKAVRLGGGFCSQHAIIFNNILMCQGMKSRILGLSGHVLNEVFLDGKWQVYDPTFGIPFGMSLKELESDHEKVYQIYKEFGRPDAEARHWQKIFASDYDNWYYHAAENYAQRGYLIYIVEKISFYFIWAIPIIIISLGIFIKRYQIIPRK